MRRTRTRRYRWLAVATAAFVAASMSPGAAASSSHDALDLQPRLPAEQPQETFMPLGTSSDTVVVKFAEGSDVRLRAGDFVSLVGADVSAANDIVAASDSAVARLFSRPEAELAADKTRIEAKSQRQQADKNLYYRIRLGDEADIDEVLDQLNALDLVELAYAAPQAAPPPGVVAPARAWLQTTPDFESLQGYLDPAPGGIDARYAWTQAGGGGGNVIIIDVEYSWNQAHEDLSKAALPGALIPNGTPVDPFADNNHGTAVLGELIADDNGFGVTGIANQAGIRMVNASNVQDGYDPADAIDIAAANLSDGDVLLIEQQIWGPESTFVPLEWLPAVYDSIVSATSDGIIVVEAAGNGGANLDLPIYGGPFPQGQPDSGAIIVGAGAAPGCTSPARGRLSFSTFGSRVDVQGWGQCVTTTGYGFLQGGPDPNLHYTQFFGGTSSASPIVAGAAALISSVVEQAGDDPLTSVEMRALLQQTGTPQDVTSPGALAGNIGPLPDVRAALEALATPSVEQLVEDLADTILALQQAGQLRPAVFNRLTLRLDALSHYVNVGDDAGACRAVNNLIRDVNRFVANGRLSAAAAASILAIADDISEELGC